MSHLDLDQLTLLALGEPVASAAETEHLADCAHCASELADLRRTALLARSTVDDSGLEAPPDRVWMRVADELGLGASAGVEASGVAAAEEEAPGVGAASPQETARVQTPAPRRRLRAFWALAASLVLVAGIGVGAWVVSSTQAPTVVAAAVLDPFPDHPDASGAADVEVARDGSRSLLVSLDGDELDDGYREVWLIRNDAAALISLGVLDGSEGSFVIPDGVDLDEYSIVDISVEPVDGDPAHSGDSIVRGQLT
ncbi:anti-sigma factor [Microbacterium sp.]|uniref:anti-sigma factor n=1 Tax=Microbacterium sp. TaxID=51671 RepID=UPI0035B189FE